MDTLTRMGFFAHAQTSGFGTKLRETQRVCREFVERCETPQCSISFGKDSVVMAHLLQQVKPDILCIHADRGAGGDTQEVYDLKAQLISEWGLNVVTVQTEKSALECFQQELPIRQYLIEAMVKAESELGVDGSALGITRDESAVRRIVVFKHGLLYTQASGMVRCYPLGKWTALDVWAYTVQHGIPYLPIYDRLAENGTPHTSPISRTSNIIGTTGIERGRLSRTAWASEEAKQFYIDHAIQIG